MVPGAGPFLTMATVGANETGTTLLLIDGIVQSAGIAMIVAWLAMPNEHLVPASDTDAAVSLTVTPMVSPRFAGVGMTATF